MELEMISSFDDATLRTARARALLPPPRRSRRRPPLAPIAGAERPPRRSRAAPLDSTLIGSPSPRALSPHTGASMGTLCVRLEDIVSVD